VSTPRFVVDLTDLLALLELHRVPMGVARVQMALLEAGLTPGTPPLFALTTFAPEQGRFVQVPPGLLLAMIRGAREGGPQDDPAWLALQEARRTARQGALGFAFERGDRVLALGLTGSNPAQLRRLRELRQAYGVVICVLFYDAIPLTTPEHCDISLSRSFSEHFLAMCLQMDRAVAISACAARDFRSWQRRVLPHLDIPVGVMPLDATFPLLEDASAGELPQVLREGRPYVLCVATLESRKNHLLLLNAWLTLLRRHGDAVIPDLVLVGRPGFQSEPVLHLMRSAPELRRRVTHLQDVGDALLGQLYTGCLFTVFNSFYEGWGLPVTEALGHGKLPLAPDHTSLREAGGTAALYFTPQSEPELAELAWSLIRDPAHRRRLEAKIPERMQLRSWREVAEGLIATLAADAPPQPEPAARVFFPLGERIGFEAPHVPDLPEVMSPFSLLHQLLCEGEGWGGQERWGIGASWGPTRLRLPLPSPHPEGLILTLEVAAPADGPALVRLRAQPPGANPGPWFAQELPAGSARPLRVEIPPCEPGDLVIEFDTGAPPEGPGRPVRIFFTGLMLCAASDRDSQLRYLAARAGVTTLRPG
jgi:glycosyltransferase involved in cell wall biosynthesis